MGNDMTSNSLIRKRFTRGCFFGSRRSISTVPSLVGLFVFRGHYGLFTRGKGMFGVWSYAG